MAQRDGTTVNLNFSPRIAGKIARSRQRAFVVANRVEFVRQIFRRLLRECASFISQIGNRMYFFFLFDCRKIIFAERSKCVAWLKGSLGRNSTNDIFRRKAQRIRGFDIDFFLTEITPRTRMQNIDVFGKQSFEQNVKLPTYTIKKNLRNRFEIFSIKVILIKWKIFSYYFFIFNKYIQYFHRNL